MWCRFPFSVKQTPSGLLGKGKRRPRRTLPRCNRKHPGPRKVDSANFFHPGSFHLTCAAPFPAGFWLGRHHVAAAAVVFTMYSVNRLRQSANDRLPGQGAKIKPLYLWLAASNIVKKKGAKCRKLRKTERYICLVPETVYIYISLSCATCPRGGRRKKEARNSSLTRVDSKSPILRAVTSYHRCLFTLSSKPTHCGERPSCS